MYLPCLTNSDIDRSDITGTGGHGQDCARPDCQHKESHLEEFFVERIVGRMKGPLSGKGDGTDQACRWLVKWEGYVRLLAP